MNINCSSCCSRAQTGAHLVLQHSSLPICQLRFLFWRFRPHIRYKIIRTIKITLRKRCIIEGTTFGLGVHVFINASEQNNGGDFKFDMKGKVSWDKMKFQSIVSAFKGHWFVSAPDLNTFCSQQRNQMRRDWRSHDSNPVVKFPGERR